MAQWFEIDEATSVVRGWSRSSADVLPAVPAGGLIVPASDEQIAQYEAMVSAAHADALAAAVTFINGTLVAPVDSRLFVRVTADKAVAQVGESIGVTVTALNADGSTNTGFAETIYYELPDGRIYGYAFAAGAASRSIAVVKSGRYRLQSTAEVRFESPVDILAVE